MNQTEQNLQRLSALVRDDKKEFAALRATARALKLPTPKRQKTAGAAATHIQNYLRGIHPTDMKNACNESGASNVFRKIQCTAILETANRKFAELKKAGGR